MMAARTEGRREKVRRATLAEIHAVVRRLLVERGPAAVTINAVAREMGMSGPALYHYYAGHEELVGAVTADFFRELTETMEQARDAVPEASPGDRLLAVCRAMRAWAVANRAEFGWIFATPIAPPNREPDSVRHVAGDRFEQVLLELTVELWEKQGFETPESLPDAILDQMTAYSAGIGGRLPPAAAHVFLSSWIRLYGLLCMEVLHQLDFAYTDLEPVFEECLRELAGTLGIGYPGR